MTGLVNPLPPQGGIRDSAYGFTGGAGSSISPLDQLHDHTEPTSFRDILAP